MLDPEKVSFTFDETISLSSESLFLSLFLGELYFLYLYVRWIQDKKITYGEL